MEKPTLYTERTNNANCVKLGSSFVVTFVTVMWQLSVCKEPFMVPDVDLTKLDYICQLLVDSCSTE